MRIIPVAVALCCTLLLSACFPPITTQPVGRAAPDNSLAGLWRANMTHAEGDEKKAWFHFVPKSDGSMLVIIISAAKKQDGDVIGATIHTARLGSVGIMNATLVKLEGTDTNDDTMPGPGTIPVLYRREGKHVSLYLMDEKATKAAINAGHVKGTVGSGDFGDATITADQPDLDRFLMSKEGMALFSDKFAELTKME
jgi:hypothetical protein